MAGFMPSRCFAELVSVFQVFQADLRTDPTRPALARVAALLESWPTWQEPRDWNLNHQFRPEPSCGEACGGYAKQPLQVKEEGQDMAKVQF